MKRYNIESYLYCLRQFIRKYQFATSNYSFNKCVADGIEMLINENTKLLEENMKLQVELNFLKNTLPTLEENSNHIPRID